MRILGILLLSLLVLPLALVAAIPLGVRFPFEWLVMKLCNTYSYLGWLRRDLVDCKTILDVGCGASSPILKIGYGSKADAIDIFRPYVMMHRIAGSYHKCDVHDIMEMEFKPKTYDAVVVCDVLEHLPKKDVYRKNLIQILEGVARKKIILFTPNGNVANNEQDGNEYQEHISAWEPRDFKKMGYTIKGATGLRYFIGTSGAMKYQPHFIFSFLTVISQPFVLHRPKLAGHTYAVKVINSWEQ